MDGAHAIVLLPVCFQEEAEACMNSLRAALLRRSVSPNVIDQCQLFGILPAVPVGCYNYTTASQMVPALYFDQLEVSLTVCRASFV